MFSYFPSGNGMHCRVTNVWKCEKRSHNLDQYSIPITSMLWSAVSWVRKVAGQEVATFWQTLHIFDRITTDSYRFPT